MTELPEDVARELEELFGGNAIPADASTLQQMANSDGYSLAVWGKRMKSLVADGTWRRGKKPGSQAFWYWKVKDEGPDKS